MVEGTRRRGWSWSSGALPLVGLVLLPVVTSLAAEQLPAGGWWVWPAIAVLAVPVMLAEMARTRRSRAAAADNGHLSDTLTWLAEAAEERWRAEAAARLLDRPDPIRLRWTAAATAAATATSRPGAGSAAPQAAGGDVADLAARLLALPSRQIVVVGAPGAGKSALAVLLTLDLLERRKADPALPVPVPLSISSWRPHAEHLTAWLARRLREDYPGLGGRDGHDRVTRMITRGLVLPVLDGLDEIPATLHTLAVEGIDLATEGGLPFVLTCRADGYERAVNGGGQVLSGASVVRLRPVGPAAAEAYLTRSAPAVARHWRGLLTGLDPDSPVWRALSTPLMLWLARAAYCDPELDPGELADTTRFPDVSKVEERLLAGYLPAVYGNGPTRPGDALRRLSFLARDLTRRRDHDLAWWRLDSGESRTPWAFAFVSAFAAFYLADAIGQSLAFLRDKQFEAAFIVTVAAVLVRFNSGRRACPPAGRDGPVRRWRATLLGGVALGFAFVAGMWLAALAALGDRVVGSVLGTAVFITAASLIIGVFVAVGGALAVPAKRRTAGVSLRERLVTAAFVGVGAALLFTAAGDRELIAPAGLAGAIMVAVLYEPLVALTAPPGEPRRITLRLRGLSAWLVLRGAAFGTAIGAQAVLLAWVVAIAFEPVPVQPGGKVMLDMEFAVYTVKVGCLSGLVVGVLVGVAWALLDPAGSTGATGPRMLLRMDRWACLIASGVAGVAVPAALLLFQDGFRPLDSLLVGAVSASAMALRFAWPRFAAARLRLALTGRLPLRLMAFLDEAYRRGVLRQDGGVYQFRHSRMRDHLAA